MTTDPQPIPHAAWTPVPTPGCVNVEGKVLLVREGLALAILRFAPEATIHEHSADHDVDVVCLDGEGFISVEDRVNTFASGQWLTWPAGRLHRLWTADRGMITLMVERLGTAGDSG
jgi:quercetin dioxygenase-like cupin family protein